MSGLAQKEILVCRSARANEQLQTVLQDAGAAVDFLQTFIVEGIADDEISVVQNALADLDKFDWLLFSSRNGIRYFKQLMEGRDVFDYSGWKFGAVGKRTVRELCDSLSIAAAAIGSNFNDLLRHVNFEDGEQTSALHLTSSASLDKLNVVVPEGLTLERLAIYHTRPNRQINAEERQHWLERHPDAVIFSSPTSFDGLCEILPDWEALTNTAVVAFGQTTASYINDKGVPVQVVPQKPEPEALRTALEVYWSNTSP